MFPLVCVTASTSVFLPPFPLLSLLPTIIRLSSMQISSTLRLRRRSPQGDTLSVTTLLNLNAFLALTALLHWGLLSPPRKNVSSKITPFLAVILLYIQLIQKLTPTLSSATGGPSLNAIFLLLSPLRAHRLRFSMWTLPTVACQLLQRTAAMCVSLGTARSTRITAVVLAAPAHLVFSVVVQTPLWRFF
ncbi:hypothetical protein P692DRAFT_201746073, partial [Suillus brevipes Sb2]